MSEHREALENIVRMCYGSTKGSRRNSSIMECAMKALGFTENQRNAKHKSWQEKNMFEENDKRCNLHKMFLNREEKRKMESLDEN